MKNVTTIQCVMILPLLVAAAMMSGCDQKSAAAPAAGGFSVPVTSTVATATDVPVSLDEIGKIVASQSVTIVPQVSGVIKKKYFNDGDMLKRDQDLFLIDPAPYQAQLDQANGQLAKDIAQQTSAAWNVTQDQTAVASKAISVQQLHNDIGTRDQAAGAILVDQAQIETAKLNLGYCHIRSPIDGRAGVRLVDEGNVVTAAGQAAGTNLLSIQTLDPIYSDFTIDEGQLGLVRECMSQGELKTLVTLPEDNMLVVGTPSTMPASMPTTGPSGATALAPKPPRGGKLIFLDNAVQDGGGTVKLRAELPNADFHFWPGEFVNVKLVLRVQKDAVMVPRRCAQLSQTGPYVYVIDEKSACHVTPVKLGQIIGDNVVIDSGLNAGQQVVATGQQLLQDGAPVMVQPTQPQGGHQ